MTALTHLEAGLGADLAPQPAPFAFGPVAEAHASWSRWCVRCGTCPSAEQLYPFVNHAGQPAPAARGRYDPPARMTCRDCGAVTEIIWPAEDFARAVERLLMMRPDPSTRSWFPPETLHDLMIENATHGIYDHVDATEAAGSPMFAVDDFGIRVDNLPASLPAAPRRELN